jgi:hypothetical protein
MSALSQDYIEKRSEKPESVTAVYYPFVIIIMASQNQPLPWPESLRLGLQTRAPPAKSSLRRSSTKQCTSWGRWR